MYEPAVSPEKEKEPSAAVAVLATVRPSRTASTFVRGSREAFTFVRRVPLAGVILGTVLLVTTLAFNFNGTVHYRGDDGRLQISLVPWECSEEFRLPVATWSDLIEHYYPQTGWIPLHADTLRALQREKAERALPTLDATVAELLDP